MTRGPIVVGVDGTEASLEALRFARDAARRERADDGLDLVVVHVRQAAWAGVGAGAVGAPMADLATTLDDIERNAEAATREALGDNDVTWRWVVREGDPAKQIVCVAKEVDARAIAVGGHRHGSLASVLLRSVDSGLVHAYDGTLLIVRPGEGARPGGSGAGALAAPASAGAAASTGG